MGIEGLEGLEGLEGDAGPGPNEDSVGGHHGNGCVGGERCERCIEHDVGADQEGAVGGTEIGDRPRVGGRIEGEL